MSEYKPDWSNAPEWARFWARDADGQAFWHKDKPTDGVVVFYHGGLSERDYNACPNWRETLQERPVAPDRNDWSGAPDWAKARAWDRYGHEYWLDDDSGSRSQTGWLWVANLDLVSDYRWPAEGWKDSLLLRPTDNTTEIRKIREELAALTERLAKLEEVAG
jgi:hypothetical protein